MKILRVEAEDYGNLTGHIKFHPGGINLWIAPNEQGKSTLASAVCEALYGPPRPFGNRTEHRRLAELRPMNGGAFKICLKVEVNDQHLVIRRDFSAGLVQVLEGGIHGIDVTDRFRAGRDEFAIGERLLELTRDEFMRSIFAHQGEMERVREAEGLTRVLQRIADTQAGPRTVTEAIELLERQESEYPLSSTGSSGRCVTLKTEKGRLQEIQAEVSSRIKELEHQRQSIQEKEQELTLLERDLNNERLERARVIYMTRKAELKEIEEDLRFDTDLREGIAQLEAELQGLSPFAAFPSAQQQNLHRWLDKIERLGGEVAKLEEQLARERCTTQEYEKQLGQLNIVRKCTRQERDTLLGLATQFEESERKERQTRKKLDEERQRMAVGGLVLERHEEITQRFRPLSQDERRFLRSVPSSRKTRELQRVQADEHLHSSVNLLKQIEAERTGREKGARVFRFIGIILFLLGMLGIVLGMPWQLMPWQLLWVGLLVVGVLMFIMSIFSLQISKSRRADEYATGQLEQRQVREVLDNLKQQTEEEAQRLAELTETAGFQSADTMLSEFSALEDLTPEVDEFHKLDAKYQEEKQDLVRFQKELCSLLKQLGIPSENATSEQVRAVLADMDRALDLKHQLQTTNQASENTVKEITGKKWELEETSKAVKQLLEDASIDADLQGDEARNAFDAMAEKALRYQQLQTDVLPRERERLLSAEKLQELRKRKEVLQQEITQAETATNGEELAMLTPDVDRTTYQQQAERLTRQLEEDQQNLYRLEREISDVLKETREIPSLQQEYDDTERRLKRAIRFEKAVAIAKEALHRIASEVHAVWADQLNKFASKAFMAILPHYQDPQFDHELRLTFAQPGYPGRIDPDCKPGTSPRLSGGTLEQIYLIVRAAIADFLAHGSVKPPLILDEPFPHSHDERFLAGMKLLAEQIAKDRQVIIFSCHKVRHDWLLENAPELRDCIHSVRFEDRSR